MVYGYALQIMDFSNLGSNHEKGCVIDWLPLVIHIPESTGDRDHALAGKSYHGAFYSRPFYTKVGHLQPFYLCLSRLGCSIGELQGVRPENFCQA